MSISAITPPTMPAMIDSTGKPGILVPMLSGGVLVNCWPLLVAVMVWVVEVEPWLKVTV